MTPPPTVVLLALPPRTNCCPVTSAAASECAGRAAWSLPANLCRFRRYTWPPETPGDEPPEDLYATAEMDEEEPDADKQVLVLVPAALWLGWRRPCCCGMVCLAAEPAR